MLGITSEAEVPDELADCQEKGGSSRAPEGKAVKGATPAHADLKGKKNLTRRLVELCCGESSTLGNSTRWTEGCLVTRITLDDDFTSDEGLWKALEAVRQGGQNVLVWVSIPCVGGSVLQYANAHHPGARRRMQRHYSLFLKLWRNACVVVEQALGQGETLR